MAKTIRSGVATCNVKWTALRLKLWCAVMTAVLCGGVFGVKSARAQFCEYEITAVVPGPNCGLFGNAPVRFQGINDYGQACGFVRECAAGPGTWPVIWSEETGLVILPLPEGAINGEAVGINNVLGADGLGQVACTLNLGQGGRAYLYSDGAWTALGTTAEYSISNAHAINDHTEIVGHLFNGAQTATFKAFHWRNGVLTIIDLPVGPSTMARDLAENGSVAGWMGSDPATSSLGFLYAKAGYVEGIEPLPETSSSDGNAVNEQQVVVGESWISIPCCAPVPQRAWRFESGQLHDFPNPDDANRTRALEINDAGQILIVSETPSSSFLWQNGNMVRIRDLFEPIAGVGFSGASGGALNNHGQFAGTGTSQGSLGIILTPIDRPLGDVNIDCTVDVHDLIAVLQEWGPCPDVGSCLCDIVTSSTFQPPGDGRVDGADLAVVLGNWSPAGSESRNTRK